MFKTVTAAAALAAFALSSTAALAQANAPAPAAKKEAPAASQAKKELVARVLQLQQQDIENMARAMVEQPALQMMQAAAPALQQRVPAEKREAVAQEIRGDLRKYVEETVPLVRQKALELAPSTIGAVLEEKMTEIELREVIRVLESPTQKKFRSLAGDMQRSIMERLVADTRPQVQQKLQALERSVAQRLGVTQPAAGASAPPPR